MSIVIKRQKEEDTEQVMSVNKLAFETTYEANLVNALIESDVNTFSLVARKDNKIVGHLLLSEMTVLNKNNSRNLKLYGLAPMSVIPNEQKQGIGKLLIKNAIEIAKDNSVDIIFVLGHPDYYPKFNFIPTNRFGVTCQYDAPPEAFMALDLTGKLPSLTGNTVLYSKIFQTLANG